jgi:hypothetical protein
MSSSSLIRRQLLTTTPERLGLRGRGRVGDDLSFDLCCESGVVIERSNDLLG